MRRFESAQGYQFPDTKRRSSLRQRLGRRHFANGLLTNSCGSNDRNGLHRLVEAFGVSVSQLAEDIRSHGSMSGLLVTIRQHCSDLEQHRDSVAQERGLGRKDYLFSSRKGGHFTKQRADQIIKAAASRASLERNVHVHLFRHGYAINFLNCEGRLDALQEQLGHRDINTTRIYLRLSDEDVKREVAKIHF